MVRYHNVNGERIPLTAEEETQRDAEEKAWNDETADRKLSIIKEYRLNKLIETLPPVYSTIPVVKELCPA